MSPQTLLDIYTRLPMPIALPLHKVLDTRNAVERFSNLLETWEETVRYLCLVHLAQYLKLRENWPDTGVDRQLARLARPSFGDLVDVLGTLESFIVSTQEPPIFGHRVTGRRRSEPCLELIRRVMDEKTKRASYHATMNAVVNLRNDTRGHGSMSSRIASEHNEHLESALGAILVGLPGLMSRPPIFVREILTIRAGRHTVSYRPLLGTSRTPLSRDCEVSSLDVLEQHGLFLWDEDKPLRLDPLMRLQRHPLTVQLFNGLHDGVPVYRVYGEPRDPVPKVLPDFLSRARLLLFALSPEGRDSSLGSFLQDDDRYQAYLKRFEAELGRMDIGERTTWGGFIVKKLRPEEFGEMLEKLEKVEGVVRAHAQTGETLDNKLLSEQRGLCSMLIKEPSPPW